MRISRQAHLPRIVLGVTFGLVVCAGFTWSARANSSIAQGFRASGNNDIVAGALVSLEAGTPNSVELATLGNRSRLVGVAGQKALVELVNGNPVQVVTSGATVTLVSDLNGVIKAGDKVTASPIDGVGMKATENTMVAGTAQSDMDVSKTESRAITNKSGAVKTVRIGSIPLLVSPVFYQASASQSQFVPSAFQNLANSVAGRNVSPVRVLVAGLLIVLLFTAVAVLLYSAVRSSIISIGRNPLSERAVHKSLFQVGVTSIGVSAFTIIIVYLILTT